MKYDLRDNNSLAIIIPAYNEEGTIALLISSIKEQVDSDIIVVNDGSSDNTALEAETSGALVLNLPFNLGYGAALQAGFKYALKKGYRYAIQMDADGQHDPSSINVLLEPILQGEVDLAIGSRFLGKGDYRATFIRRAGMYFFATITTIITGKKVTDPTSGFRAFNKRVMEFYAGEDYPVDYPDADVIIMLHRKGIKFKEVPVIMRNNKKGKSMHSGLMPLYYLFKMMLSIFVIMLRKKS